LTENGFFESMGAELVEGRFGGYETGCVKKYVVTLDGAERERLAALIRAGKHSARKLLRARI